MSTIKADAITAVSANGDLIIDGLGTGGVSIASTLKMAKGGDIASASPLVIDTDGSYYDVTGTVNFASMTVEAGNFFMLQFDGALTITHGSGIELPGAVNLTTASGDRLICYATAANTVEVMSVETEAVVASGASLTSLQTFTASGTWTKPSGLVRAKVIVTGAGGGSSGTANDRVAGAGSAGGTAIELLANASLGGTETVTIGTAGTAGASGANDGGAGGTSSFGSLLSATGGAGGDARDGGSNAVVGGVGSGGDINLLGGGGAGGASSTMSSGAQANNGGASYWGGGGGVSNLRNADANSVPVAQAGQAPGSGGGGATTNYAAIVGAAGAAGIVVVWEYV